MRKLILLIQILFSTLQFISQVETVTNSDIKEDSNEEIFSVVEEQPQFPGGMEKLLEFLITNIKYPDLAVKQGIQGKVFVAFIVNKTGKIRDAKIVRGVHESLDKEALRVISIMPNWTPGKQNGEAINCRFTLPISFKI